MDSSMADLEGESLHPDIHYTIFEKMFWKLPLNQLLVQMDLNPRFFEVGLRFLGRIKSLRLRKNEAGGLITELKVDSNLKEAWYTSEDPSIFSLLATISHLSLSEIDISKYPHEDEDDILKQLVQFNLENLEVVKLYQQCSCSQCPLLVTKSKKLKCIEGPSGKTLNALPDSMNLDKLSISSRAIRSAFNERLCDDKYLMDIIKEEKDHLGSRGKVTCLKINDAATVRALPYLLTSMVENLSVERLCFRDNSSKNDDEMACDLGFAVVTGDRSGTTNQYWDEDVRFSSVSELTSIHSFPTRKSLLHLLKAKRWFPKGLQLAFNGKKTSDKILTKLPELVQLLYINRLGSGVSIHVVYSDLTDTESHPMDDFQKGLKTVFFTVGFYPVYLSHNEKTLTVDAFYDIELKEKVQLVVHKSADN